MKRRGFLASAAALFAAPALAKGPVAEVAAPAAEYAGLGEYVMYSGYDTLNYSPSLFGFWQDIGVVLRVSNGVAQVAFGDNVVSADAADTLYVGDMVSRESVVDNAVRRMVAWGDNG